MTIERMIEALTQENLYVTYKTQNKLVFKLNTPACDVTRFIWALYKLNLKTGASLKDAQAKFDKLMTKAQDRLTIHGWGYNKDESALEIVMLHLSYIKGYEHLRDFKVSCTRYSD